MLGKVTIAGLLLALGACAQGSQSVTSASPQDLFRFASELCPDNLSRTYDLDGRPLSRKFMGASTTSPGACFEIVTYDNKTFEATTLFGMFLGRYLYDDRGQYLYDISGLASGFYPILSGQRRKNYFRMLFVGGVSDVEVETDTEDTKKIASSFASPQVLHVTVTTLVSGAMRYPLANKDFFVAYDRQADGTALFIGEDNGSKAKYVWKRMVIQSSDVKP